MLCGLTCNDFARVTTHTGGVDWNLTTRAKHKTKLVTTHTGGVDWNTTRWLSSLREIVTTHTGGVDWNRSRQVQRVHTQSHHPHGWCGLKYKIGGNGGDTEPSHHPHGWCGLKWIWQAIAWHLTTVTTHTGGVDWNRKYQNWRKADLVTTHTGGVDWNTSSSTKSSDTVSHHPHGWCGLKSINRNAFVFPTIVTTHTGGVDWNFLAYKSLAKDFAVTTHTGGVDWNKRTRRKKELLYSHHPHGWCGLKSHALLKTTNARMSPPTRVVWIEIL